MSIEKSLHSSPQLVFKQQGVAVAPKQLVALYKKSQQSNIPVTALIEVYQRGMLNYMLVKEQVKETAEQFAFNRVNSFIAGGKAMELDKDLVEKNRGLWDNIHAKRERIKHGSGEHMRKPGSKGAPTPQDLKRSQTKEEYTGAEKVSKDHINPANRFVGTNELTNNYKETTPGQSKTLSIIKKVVKEQQEINECANGKCMCAQGNIDETETWQHAKYKNKEGGMTRAGVMAYRREHPGSKLKTAVTTKPSKLKAGSKAANRRKSFCARMSGVEGPMKKPNGEPTRKALALRKWNC